MAQEMLIIFVYDTQIVQREEDDPVTAVLYFHPNWVSDQQRVALCGQLMGAARSIKGLLSNVNLISLQSGRFYLKEFGQFILAVGTDRNVTDWLMEHRANIIASTLSFFHHDLTHMARLYSTAEEMSEKLYQFFDTYLKRLFLGGNLFGHITSMDLPKTASSVFMNAIQILETCRTYKHVLGGTLLFHNRVVVSQLSPEITKMIVLTKPHSIDSSAEIANVTFDIPIGIQLIQVYIGIKEYKKILKNNKRVLNEYSKIEQPIGLDGGQYLKLNGKKYASSSDVREQTDSINGSIRPENGGHSWKNLSRKEKACTITDPYFPYFRSGGAVASSNFYENCLNNDTTHNHKDQNNLTRYGKLNNNHRQSLSLPLDETEALGPSSDAVMSPLMSKLSINTQTSTKSPSFGMPKTFPVDLHRSKDGPDSKDSLQKCILFSCGIGNISVTLILQEDIPISAINLIELYRVCTENLANLEVQLRQTVQSHRSSASDQSETEAYSYLYLDPEWDVTRRGGTWTNMELGNLTYLHRDFKTDPNMSDILLRYHDGVIYSNNTERVEVFYQQSGPSQAGIPTESDLMGQAPVKAKKRLEKDHSINIP